METNRVVTVYVMLYNHIKNVLSVSLNETLKKIVQLILLTETNHNKNVLSALLNKIFPSSFLLPSFLPSFLPNFSIPLENCHFLYLRIALGK